MLLYDEALTDATGNIIPGAVVHVFLAGGGSTYATLASDINRTPKANPLTVGSDGRITFWIDPGLYNIDIFPPGVGTSTNRDIQVLGCYYSVTCGSSVAAGVTNYLTPSGESSGADDAAYMVNRAGYMTGIRVKSTLAPGTGQTYTYNIQKNGVTVTTITLSGAVDTLGTNTTPVEHVAGDHYRVQLVTSGTAAVANHRAVLEFC